MIGQLVTDALVVLGLVVMTLGVLGMFRLPDVFAQTQATSKAASLGLIALAGGAVVAAAGGTATKAILIAVFVLLTTPVGAHAIILAAHRRGEPMATPHVLDETAAGEPADTGRRA